MKTLEQIVKDEETFVAYLNEQFPATVAELEKVRGEAEGLRKDKERLDWLDSSYLSVDFWIGLQGATDLRQAIDTAIRKQSKKESEG